MRKLEELIQEFCPDGVEYKKLGDVATIIRGGNLQKKDFTDIGIPCIHYGQIYTRYGLFADKTFTFISENIAAKQKYAKPNDIVMAVTSENIEDVCKCVAWLGDKPVAVSGHTAIIHHNQNPRYMCYYFHSTHFKVQKNRFVHGTKVMEVTPSKLNNIILPVPPLPVQSEIVRILDNLTGLTTELTTELTARKKQYEYYKSQILSFGKEIKWEKLFNIAEFQNGKGHEKVIVESGKYIVINSKFISTDGKVKKYSDTQLVPLHQNDIVMVMSDLPNGKALAKCYLVKSENLYTLNQRIGAFSVKNSDVMNTKFLFYVLNRNNQLLRYDNRTDQTNLRKNDILDILIPVPPIEEQKRIVAILDHFDRLCNDISQGLPAEIEARQKQYEYYRDKLLTFTTKA